VLWASREFQENIMLYYSAIFFIIALVAAAFGFGGIAAGAVGVARILFVIFLLMFVSTLLMHSRGSGTAGH
jgi:uncharacterized membrane protein YtjA (UPF0391 family)